MALQPDDILENKYRIVRLLGEGGMGAVYEGLNTRIQRRVAIKVLHSGSGNHPGAIERFEREAQAAGRIGSKHIVQVLDLGDLPGGERYMVMEYLDGIDLTRRIRSLGKLHPRELYPIAVQILEGLVAAHDAGIVHRDLKPDNVFIVPEGEYADFAKILDFGISKFQKGSEFSMTQTGMVMGTPYYMSPEQAKGSKDVDHRTDLYSLGVIMYEALSGHVPYSAETFNALILKIVLEDPRPLEEPRNDEERAFHAIVRKAMSRPLDTRYQSAAEFQGDLHDWARTFDVPLSSIVKHRSNFPPPTTHVHGTQRAWTQTGPLVNAHAGTERPSAEIPQVRTGLLMKVAAGLTLAVVVLGAWLLTRPSPSAEGPEAPSEPVVGSTSPAAPSARSPLSPAATPDTSAVAPRPTPDPNTQDTAALPKAASERGDETRKPESPQPKKPTNAQASDTSERPSSKAAPATKPVAPVRDPAPSSTPREETKPPTKSTTSSGRTIRTEL
jgi:serine/threonine protein kinase